MLSPSLLGVFLWLREHSVSISGDIKGMLHQVLLLPEDKPLLASVQHVEGRQHLKSMSGKCCLSGPHAAHVATCALQWHVFDHNSTDSEEQFSI